MNDNQLKLLWQTAHQQLETSIFIHQKNTEDITQIKVQNILASMKPIKIFTLIVGIIWVLFVDNLIINLYNIASLFFLISASIQVIITKIAIGIYLYHLVLIRQVDVSEPIVATQEKLSKMQASTLWVTRILFLQLPVWTTFYWNNTMLENGNIVLWTIQILVTLAFIFIAIWLFVNINSQNRHQKWFQWIFSGKEWQPILLSMELLEQVNQYKKEQ